MAITAINAPDSQPPAGGYAQAVCVDGCEKLLFVSGQIPVDLEGNVPTDLAGQCRLIWRNIGAQLAAAGMTFADLVKVTTFLSDRAHAEVNSAIRREVLGEHAPALTVIVCDIYDPAWLLEIEAIAARRRP